MSRRIHSLSDPEVFLEYAGDWLYRDEVRNNLILGTVAHLASVPPKSELDFLVIEDSGQIEGCALLLSSGRLILTDCSSEALCILAEDYIRFRSSIRGVSGPCSASERFAEVWSGCSQLKSRRVMTQVLFKLASTALPDVSVPGKLRRASIEDLEIAAEWLEWFGDEAGISGLNSTEEGLRLILSGALFFWQDQELKCMAAVTGRTYHGARIGWVYTRSESRGHGYATAAVTSLSRKLLESGLEFCCLFADQANPFSIRLYEKIGYRPVEYFADFFFAESDLDG